MTSCVVFTTRRAKDLPIFTEGVGKKGQVNGVIRPCPTKCRTRVI
jgi:hypothetical protein